MHSPSDVDAASAWIVARLTEPELRRWHDNVGRGRDIERGVHRQGQDQRHGRSPTDRFASAAFATPKPRHPDPDQLLRGYVVSRTHNTEFLGIAKALKLAASQSSRSEGMRNVTQL